MPAERVGVGPAARDSSLLSIGEVLARLRAEFPDTTISKLRFLETEGLVAPQRTPSGYRKYSDDDVSRLRFVLAAQRDQYLPLRVIRQQLDTGAHLVPPPAQVPPAAPRPPLAAVRDTHVPPEPDPERWYRDGLCEQAQISPDLLADLESHGLVTERPGGWFDADAVTIAEVAGLLAGYGIQPRHLRPFRAAADREAGLYAQIVAPLLRQQSPAGQERAGEALRELMLLSQRIHLALLRSGLSETLG